MSESDIRWQQRLQSFRKAFQRLSDAVQIIQARKLSAAYKVPVPSAVTQRRQLGVLLRTFVRK